MIVGVVAVRAVPLGAGPALALTVPTAIAARDLEMTECIRIAKPPLRIVGCGGAEWITIWPLCIRCRRRRETRTATGVDIVKLKATIIFCPTKV